MATNKKITERQIQTINKLARWCIIEKIWVNSIKHHNQHRVYDQKPVSHISMKLPENKLCKLYKSDKGS